MVGGCVGAVVVLIAWPGLVLCWCAAPLMLGRAVLVRAPPPCWGVLCWCLPPPILGRDVLVCAPPPSMPRRAVLARGPPHGRACCLIKGPPLWRRVLCWCLTRLMVGRAVLVPVRRGGCARCGGVGHGLSLSVLPVVQRRCVWVGGVFAGATPGLFCWFSVVFAALRSSPPYGRRVRVAVVRGLVAVVVVLFAWPGLVLRWCMTSLMVGFAALVSAPPPLC